MFETHRPAPDGYARRSGDGIELIDPKACPAGHPFRWGQRGLTPCYPHGGHPKWTCACGQVIYREAGAFVGALSCR